MISVHLLMVVYFMRHFTYILLINFGELLQLVAATIN